ncbi:DGQHR domain-containing protein [Phyllobacterium sp. 1468]|uniref:DGQHR domain-containing protein n=1 Tax=Phyllobacterium sp. 1468 TaxID=2817759 RepID=UPI00285E8F13|nr:DGQHR domain-containing protein [Phyllobacterium sp. 1468]MDR6634583.1 DGQHR domain-containing protein [Phyllobacterium sp. 1468]
MVEDLEKGTASLNDTDRLRYSVSLVKQGRHQFYTLTMPSEILAQTCVVTTRKEDPIQGFQRELDEKRAMEIANYIDEDMGTIPNSIVLSAQPSAHLKIVGRGKTLEFTKDKAAFLILDGQHRVYGFSKARTSLRVPVVIYNGLSRKEETRLFIDINTKQRPVPSHLLLDIKQLAESETESEEILRDVFDFFDQEIGSVMAGLLSAAEASRSKITRVTFNNAVKPLLPLFAGRETHDIYTILNAYLTAVSAELGKRTSISLLVKPVVFRALMAFFRPVAQRVVDRFGSQYTAANFQEIVSPVFANLPMKRLESTGTSWTTLRDYFEERLRSKLTL